MKKFSFILVLCFSIGSFAQDLRGTWINIALSGDNSYDDIVLTTKSGNEYDGSSVDEDKNGGFCNFKHKASFNPETKLYVGEDYELIEKSETHVGCHFRLRYIKDGKREYLIGQIYLKHNDGTVSFPQYVRYMREVPEVSEEDKKVVETYKKDRSNKQIAQIKVPVKDMKIKVRDYGQVDGDSITIFYNNKMLAHKIAIDADEDVIDLELDVTAKEHKLYFVANNLGKVAPNTARVEIEIGEKKYEYTLFTNDKQNALLLFAPIWKKDEYQFLETPEPDTTSTDEQNLKENKNKSKIRIEKVNPKPKSQFGEVI